MPSSPFVSLASLEQDFAGGLAAMLDKHRGLGVSILVLANALWARLSLALAKRHAELAAELTATLRRADKLAEPDDDVMVFLKLNLIGFDHLGRLESRRAGPWEVMFNPVRALRPPRISGQQFEGEYLQRIPGQYCGCLIECAMGGRTAAAQVIIVHGRQIIMHQ